MEKVNTSVCIAGAVGLASLAYMALSRPRSAESSLPTKMKKLFLVEPNPDLNKAKLQVREVHVPRPGPGEVLVKMSAAPVNPSDYGQWASKVPVASETSPIGLEGAGVVVASGGGLSANRLVGKTVGVAGRDLGTHAEYVRIHAMHAFPMRSCIKPEVAASFFVNPFTVMGILDTAASRGSKAFIHTAAASQLGQMMVKLCASSKNNMTIVNVVRRQEQGDILRNLGAEYIVCTADKDWKEQLSNLIDELNIKVAFDALAGEMSGTLLSLLPSRGTCFVYGGLSKQPVANVDPIGLIYGKKKLEGFFLSTWMENGGTLKMTARLRKANRMVNEGLLPGGWAESTFVDCRLEDMQTKFLEMWNKEGFTGKKLRIRMD